jgi:hypothetical protein
MASRSPLGQGIPRELRAWIAAFDAFLQGRRPAPPEMDCHQCRFGAWVDAEILAGHGAHPVFQAIDAGHRRIHGLADWILSSLAQGRKAEGLASLGELHALCNNLLEKLEILKSSPNYAGAEENKLPKKLRFRLFPRKTPPLPKTPSN